MYDQDLTCSLGRSGLKVSKVILGCMSFGSKDWMKWVLEEDEALEILHHAYQSGINTWDTADVYSDGKSEEIVGKALVKYKIPRNRVVIMTKCYFGVKDEPAKNEDPNNLLHGMMEAPVNGMGLSRKHIFDAVEASVKRLGTYIDVLQIHRLDKETPKEEIMRALNDVVEKGWVRYIGASSMAALEFQQLQNIADKHGWHKFINMQNLYNLLYREQEREMIPYCRDTGVGLTPWYSLAAGLLARPWDDKSTERIQTDPYISVVMGSTENNGDKKIVDRVQELAKKKGVSMAQVALAWSLSKKGITPILGLNKKERIDEAVAALKVSLTDEEVAYLEEPYSPKPIVEYQ